MSEFSDLNETDASNTLFSGVNVAEGCPPGNVNNWMRAFAGATRRWFKSSLFRLRDGTDQTKLLAFDLSGIATGTTRTLKVPNADGTIYTDASPMSGYRNKIINGDFERSERGGPFTTAGYTLDRWKYVPGSGASNTIQRSNAASGELRNIGRYSLLWARSVAGSATSALQQFIEGVHTLSDGKVTVTIWANANADTEIQISLQQFFGSGGSPSSTVAATVAAGSNQVLSLTTVMRKFNVVFDVPSISGKTLGDNDNDALVLNISRTHTAPNPTTTIRLRHVSLVEGDATGEADPFSPRHPQQELALCQRYLRTFGGMSASEHICIGQAISAATANFDVSLPTEMRTTPSLTVLLAGNWRASDDDGSALVIQSMSLGTGSTARSVMITANVNASPLTAGQATRLFAGSIDARLWLDAEL